MNPVAIATNAPKYECYNTVQRMPMNSTTSASDTDHLQWSMPSATSQSTTSPQTNRRIRPMTAPSLRCPNLVTSTPVDYRKQAAQFKWGTVRIDDNGRVKSHVNNATQTKCGDNGTSVGAAAVGVVGLCEPNELYRQQDTERMALQRRKDSQRQIALDAMRMAEERRMRTYANFIFVFIFIQLLINRQQIAC